MTYALHIDSRSNQVQIIGEGKDEGFKLSLSTTRALSATLTSKITKISYHGSKAPNKDLFANYFEPLKSAPIEAITVTYKEPSPEKHRFDYLRALNPIKVSSLSINAPIMVKAVDLHDLIDHFASDVVTMKSLFAEASKLKVTLFQIKVDNQSASEAQKTRGLIGRGILDGAYNLDAEKEKPGVAANYFNLSRAHSRSTTSSPMLSPLGSINEDGDETDEFSSETDSEKSSPAATTRSRRVAWLSPTSSTKNNKTLALFRSDNSDGKLTARNPSVDNDTAKAPQSPFTRSRKIK